MSQERDAAIARNMVALSRRKKKGGNSRSKMLKVIMPHLSQETGKKLAQAIEKKNVGLFKKTWDQVKSEIADLLGDRKSESSVAPMPYGDFVKEGEKPTAEQLEKSQSAPCLGLADGSGELTQTPDGTPEYFTKDEVRALAREKYTPEQLAEAARILNREGFLEEMHNQIVEDLYLDEESTSAGYHDYSRVLSNKGFNGSNILQFVANGVVRLYKDEDGERQNYILKLSNISTVGNTRGGDLDNVDVKVIAHLYVMDEHKPIKELREVGSLAAAATELVLKAAALINK